MEFPANNGTKSLRDCGRGVAALRNRCGGRTDLKSEKADCVPL
jgi:hypothetical protein